MIGKHRQGYALLTSILACLFLGMFIGLSFMRSSSLNIRGTVSRNVEDALYAAEAGVHHAISALRFSGLGWTGTNGLENIENNGKVYGRYQIAVDNANIQQSASWRIVPVTVVGWNADQTASRQINARIRWQSLGEFFISTFSDLDIAKGATLDAGILGRNITFATATQAQPITIQGTVNHFGNISGYNADNAGSYPYITITGNPKTELISPPAAPVVDSARYSSLANDGGYYQASGSLTISGNLSRSTSLGGATGPSADNGVVFVNGDVYISATVAESMAIVATGNIYITGDVMYANQNDPSIQLGLFAKGNIIVNSPPAGGDRTLQAMLISEQRFYAQGSPGSCGTLNFNGAMSIRGQPSTSTTAIDLAAFASRNYVYHSELSTACTIPAMIYLAYLDSWEIFGDPFVFADQ